MRRKLVLIGLGTATIVIAISHRWWQPQLKSWLTQLLEFFGGGDNLQGLDSLIGIVTVIMVGCMAVWAWSERKQPGSTVGSQEEIDPTRSARSRNEQLLLEEVKREVRLRLDSSLHNFVLMTLDKQLQPQQVQRSWGMDVKIGDRAPEPLPSEIEIWTVFERSDIQGKLLILGDPGSGKTTTLLHLAQALIEKAETDPTYPIPVLLNLSSWKDPQQEMKDWLIAELKSKYGVSTELGKKWIEQKQLLPLLDGLDEVRPDRQASCVQAINQFLQSEFRPRFAVVCSRREEYDLIETQLQLNGAICLQDLSDTQLEAYLMRMNRADLWQLIQPCWN